MLNSVAKFFNIDEMSSCKCMREIELDRTKKSVRIMENNVWKQIQLVSISYCILHIAYCILHSNTGRTERVHGAW